VRSVSALFLFTALAAPLVTPSTAAAQDFDPQGRHHPPPPAHPPAKHPDNAGPAPSPGPGAGAAQAQLVQRYTRVVLAQPGAAFPLQRLAQLYRDRDGNIAALIKDFEARSAQAGAEQYGGLVALAGLYKVDGRAQDAVATYERAIAVKGDDAAALLALAHLHEERGERAEARVGYERALALQTAQADKEQTLRTLMGLALDEKDWDGAKQVHRELLKLEPTSLFVRGELGRELFIRGE
jgi:tetratricopeptide (TPR) repeat protein